MPKAMHRDTAVKLALAIVATILAVYAVDAVRPEPALHIVPAGDPRPASPAPQPFRHITPPSFERAGQ